MTIGNSWRRAGKVLLACTLLGGASLGHAAIYSSQAVFLAANPNLTLENFEGICASGTCAVPAFGGFSATGPNAVIADGGTFGAPSDWLADNTFNGNLSLTFNPSINAVGFNLSAGFSGGNMQIDIYDGATLLDTEVVATTALSSFNTFFGIDGLGSINNLRIVVNNQSAFVNIDNLRFGNTQVPEPLTAALVGLGLLGIAATRRRGS